MENSLSLNVEMEAKLIELIHSRPHIWDVTNSLYTKKKLKLQTYKEIGVVMSILYPTHKEIFGYELLMKRFNSMKNYYRKQNKKLKSLPSGSSGSDIPSQWEHYQRLSFLDPVINSQPSMNNLDDITFQDKEEIAIDSEEEVISLKRKIPSPEQSFTHKRRALLYGEVVNTLDRISNKLYNEVRSEKQKFGDLVADLVYSIKDLKRRSALRTEIFGLINEYIQNSEKDNSLLKS